MTQKAADSVFLDFERHGMIAKLFKYFLVVSFFEVFAPPPA